MKKKHDIIHPKGICFVSKDLNKEKYEAIKSFAEKVVECKNYLSAFYYAFYHFKRKISKYDFWKEMQNDKIHEVFDIPSSIFQQACFDVWSKYFKKKPPKCIVTFKKLSFIGINLCKKPMFVQSNNIHTNGIINFNIPKQECIAIPFKYSKKYHGNLDDIHYSKTGPNQCQYQKAYRLTIDEASNIIKISITEENDEYYELEYEKEKILGIDVNVSRNLFACSDGHTITHNKKIVTKLINNDLKNRRIAETKQRRGLNQEHGKKQKKIDKKDMNRAKWHIISKLLELFRYAKVMGYNHLVFEDLSPFYGKKYIKSKYNDINHNELMHILHLFDIKNVAVALGKKYGFLVSLVPAAYTSKGCPVCGHIASENRLTQSHFKCLCCGHEMDADINAALNIKNRITVEVLRQKMTTKREKQCFDTKELTLDETKNIINNYYSNIY